MKQANLGSLGDANITCDWNEDLTISRRYPNGYCYSVYLTAPMIRRLARFIRTHVPDGDALLDGTKGKGRCILKSLYGSGDYGT